MENLTIPEGTEVINLEISVADYKKHIDIFKGINKELKRVYVKGEVIGDEHAQGLLKAAKKAYREYYEYLEKIKS